MVRAVLVVMVVAGLSTACAPAYGRYGAPGLRGWSQTPAPGPSMNIAAVTGRWDNVMMLPTHAQIHVLRMDGVQAEGEILAATATALKLLVAAGEVEIPVDDIMRIDRVSGSGKKRGVLSGAAHGVGLVGFLGLVAGQVPPARLFAAGALAGAEAGYHAEVPNGPHTIYLAPHLRR